MDELSIRSCRAAIAASAGTSFVLAQLSASRAALAAARELLREPIFPYDERALRRRG